MVSQPLHVLFLSTANTARSLMSEVLLRDLAGGRAHCFSAGTTPVGTICPDVERYLSKKGYETAGLFSKTLQLFLEDGAPHIDLVVTVSACDERMPVLGPLGALRVHWEMPSIIDISSSAERKSMVKASYKALEDCIFQVLQPSWDGLTAREVQKLFERVQPKNTSLMSNNIAIPESLLFELGAEKIVYA
ncbi:hypothetical protein [Kiloniella antarctica]|uniref:Phosphotyrosine protein phosphatase I domain-containing protein n=1 Tax=Kiloniella antarctica TaxID=1550907 RepID=A0ABW5BEH8_9PROT